MEPISKAEAKKRSGKDSGCNSPVGSDQEDNKEEPILSSISVLGDENCPISPDDTEVEYCMVYNIQKITGLDNCTKLTRLGLRKNRIKVIEGLNHNLQQRELELYEKLINKIETKTHLTYRNGRA